MYVCIYADMGILMSSLFIKVKKKSMNLYINDLVYSYFFLACDPGGNWVSLMFYL